MPTITFPDGRQKQFAEAVTVQQVAQDIGNSLAKAALAGKVAGQLVDTSRLIDHDTDLSIITDKDQDGLEIIRHSTAHLLAHAVKELYPDAQVTIGPVIEDGFYYDFAYPPGFNLDDLPKIEQRMREIATRNYAVTREEISRDEALKLFRGMGEEYKAKIIEDIPGDQILSIYRQGDFVDLCRGPHAPTTGKLTAFKLTKLAGAYWRGDSNNEMLVRIYGTAWPDNKQLNDYLQRLEEAEKRDHRKLAKKMDLFHIQDEAPGMIFWHPKGAMLYHTVQTYTRELMVKYGYLEVRTPVLVDSSLWKKSGHLEQFGEAMFLVQADPHTYAMKPMNCPCHVQVFNQGLKSYRDLPLRYAEFGLLHRNEPSGTLHGLLRIRGFVQDDAHIFCTEDQIQSEVSAFLDQVFSIYTDFGFNDVLLKLSTRPDKRLGDDAIWDKAEGALERALNDKQIKWELNPGEGAFYGPKIEFSLRDSIGRVWQCGTMQVDFSMPNRLGASYIAEDGSKQVPVMLHRAMLGSIERFLGILIEHYAGNFPVWLAPLQVMVLNITDAQTEYVKSITAKLRLVGVRAETDLRNEKIGFKIREHTIQRVPYLLVIGDREQAAGAVAIRTQAGKDLGVMPVDEFIKHIQADINDRKLLED